MAPPRRPTLRDVAARTGLSTAAVSYALRGQQVSKATIERVRAAAAELGYEADPIARAMRSGQTGVVGVLTGSLADFWTQELVRALQRALRNEGAHTLIADADGSPARELDSARHLADQRVDALVAIPIGPASEGWEAIARRLPLITIGDVLRGVPTRGEVAFDHTVAVAAILAHLHELGHRRIAMLSWAVATSPDRPAERILAREADRVGLECLTFATRYSLNGSQPLAESLLRDPRRPTAVVCTSDSIAYGVYAACRVLGVSVPGDLSVVGFDDHPVSRLLAPPLTSVDWDVEAIAATTAALTHRALADADGHAGRTLVTPTFRPRASTGPAPVSRTTPPARPR